MLTDSEATFSLKKQPTVQISDDVQNHNEENGEKKAEHILLGSGRGRELRRKCG